MNWTQRERAGEWVRVGPRGEEALSSWQREGRTVAFMRWAAFFSHTGTVHLHHGTQRPRSWIIYPFTRWCYCKMVLISRWWQNSQKHVNRYRHGQVHIFCSTCNGVAGQCQFYYLDTRNLNIFILCAFFFSQAINVCYSDKFLWNTKHWGWDEIQDRPETGGE